MDLRHEWREYEAEDQRTHPLGTCRIEMEYADGRRHVGTWSEDSFTPSGAAPTTQPMRWRYLEVEDVY